MATNCLQRQITANRGMSLATREQKAVMTNFVLCRVFCYFLTPKSKENKTIERMKDNRLGFKLTANNTLRY